jgi:VWFA-related protein
MKRLVVLMIVGTAAVTVAAQAPQEQQPQPQPATQTQTETPVQGPTFRTGVDVIAVDVAVVDDRGRPVADLLPPDFVVKIDGRERRVVSAEQVRIDVEAARKQAANPFETLYSTNLVPPNGRMIILAVDQGQIRVGAARALLNTAVKFLDMLSPADRTAFVAYPEPGVYVDFTNDKLRLKLAMERVVGNQQRYTGKFNIGLYEAIQITDKGDERVFLIVSGRECRRLAGPALEQCERDVLTEAALMVRSVRTETTASLRGLYDLIRQLSIIEGPKTLILLSEGIVLESPSDLDDVIRAAAVARVSINVLLMDVPRDDITTSVMRPTISEDRDLQVSGLRNLAAGSRGAIYNVIGTGENIFERLSSETSAYYLLGVEQATGDRDGEEHRIDVEVRRRGVTVRSRRAFVMAAAAENARRKPEEILIDALRTPFGVTEVPLRLTTFTRAGGPDGKVRVMVAAEVGQPGNAREDYTVGYALLDDLGNVVASRAERTTLTAPNGMTTAPLDYLNEFLVEPGVYTLRFGVVDSFGRRGGVVRDVRAWKLAGEEFALGDLLVGELTGTGGDQRVRPGVEPRVGSGSLGAMIDLYSTSPASFDNAVVTFEIADDQDSPALLSTNASLIAGPQPTWRTAQSFISPDLLPPGRYVARARVKRDDKIEGVLVRPFYLDATAIVGEPRALRGLRIGAVSGFDADAVAEPAVLSSMLDLVEKRAPALKDAMVAARAGRYGSAAVEALVAGEQEVAAFLKGLEWYTKGDLNQAATQLALAAGPRREFFPAAFYLGAAFAAAGRDRDAAGVWQLALGTEARPSYAYTLLADARFRDGQPEAVVDVLRGAHQRAPMDDEIARRLAMAYLLMARYPDVIPVLDRYLARRPTDQEALFAAVFSQYQVTAREKVSVSTAELTKLGRYVRAYKGPEAPLLSKYLEVIRGR